MRLRYYISGHGLGHASRSLQILASLRRRHPQLAVEIVSCAAPWFLAAATGDGIPLRRAAFDIGVVQRDSLEMDLSASVEAWQTLLEQRDPRLAAESASLRQSQVDLVVSDIPALPLAAARRAGIPGVGLSNFSWDWILRGLVAEAPAFAAIADRLETDYAEAERFLVLPFHGDFAAGPEVEHLPLVARRARRPAAAVRTDLGIPAGRRLALISFGGFGLADFDFSPLARLEDWFFLSEPGLDQQLPNLRSIPPGSFPYPDLVAAADVVVTKPGYGIVSEAIANRTALLYTERGNFREQQLLVAGIRRYGRTLRIGNEELRSGNWGEALDALLALPAPTQTLASDGDVVAADRLAALAAASHAKRRGAS